MQQKTSQFAARFFVKATVKPNKLFIITPLQKIKIWDKIIIQEKNGL